MKHHNNTFKNKISFPLIFIFCLLGINKISIALILIFCLFIIFLDEMKLILLNLNTLYYFSWLLWQMLVSAFKLLKLLYTTTPKKTINLRIDSVMSDACYDNIESHLISKNCFLTTNHAPEKEFLFANTITLTPGTYSIFCYTENSGYYIINTIYTNESSELKALHAMKSNLFFKGA